MNQNVDTLRRIHAAFSEHNLDEAMRLVALTTNVVDHGRGQRLSTREEFRAWLEAFLAMSSDMQIVDAHYIGAGDWVTAQFRAIGTQDGPMDMFPASNKSYTLDVCEVWHFNPAGEADEGHNYSDGLGLLMQLGHIQPSG